MRKKMTKGLAVALHKDMEAKFRASLDSFGPAFKKKQKEDMVAGFKDGMRSMYSALVQMKVFDESDGD